MLLAILAAATFDAPPIEQFNGQSWGQIQLDQTRDRDMKSMFETDRGAIRPEALLLKQPAGAIYRISALLDGRGSDARVIGFSLSPQGATLPRRVLAPLGPAETRFVSGRWSQWRLAVWPSKGIAAALSDEAVYSILLTSPARIKSLADALPTRETATRNYERLAGEWSPSLVYRTTSSSVTFRNGLTSLQKDRIEDFNREMLRRISGDYLRQGPGSGRASVRVTVAKDGNRDRAKITANAEFWGPVQGVTVSADGEATIRVDLNGGSVVAGILIVEAADAAIEQAAEEAVDKVSFIRPPTIPELRAEAWLAIVNRFVSGPSQAVKIL